MDLVDCRSPVVDITEVLVQESEIEWLHEY